MDKKEWLQVLISQDLKRQLKAKAAQDGENMTTVIEALIQAYLDGELKPTIHHTPA